MANGPDLYALPAALPVPVDDGAAERRGEGVVRDRVV